MDDGAVMFDPDHHARIAGVISGAFLALVFMPAKTAIDFARRVAAAIVFGGLFGHVAMEWMDWARSWENLAASYAVASYASWWVLGAAAKFFSKDR